MSHTQARKIILAACFNALTGSIVLADYEVPNAAYDVSVTNPNYYNTATGTGSTLKFNLNEIIDGHTVRTYSNSANDSAMLACDEDFNNSSNVTLIYSGVSIAKSLVLNTNYNREHMWPQSYGLDGVNPAYSDLYNLRVCDMNVNSDRGNQYYDEPPVGSRKVGNVEAPDTWEDNSDTMWEPMNVEKGEIARAMFYMDTRYEGQGNDGGNPNLTLTDTVANIDANNANMGKLSTLLKWHYQHGVSNRERRRNHLLHSNATWGQGNRNPFVDHPEYVWSVFGDGANDSKFYVGASAPSNGTSAATVDLGRVIAGQTLGTGTITLNKAGADPTTYDVSIGGSATTTAEGTGQVIDYGTQSRVLTVGLSGSTSTPGLKTGTVTVNNTDITNQGTGTGNQDGDDIITVNASILSHSKPSLNNLSQQTSLTLNFGTVAQGTGLQSLPFGVTNMIVTAGYTANLDLDGISGTGNTSTLTTNFATLANLVAGNTQAFNALINTSTNGIYNATYTITNSDENIPGATNGTNLVLTLTGTVKTRQWNVNTNGNWSTTANWLGPVPTATGDTANFWNVITAPHTVTLDGNKSVGTLNFDSTFKYTLAGSSTLSLNSGSGATVTVVSGSHDITAPVAMDSNTSISVPTSSTLKISNFQASTFNLTKTGAGTLQLNNTRAGFVTISAGKVEMLANGTADGVSKIKSLSIAPGSGSSYLGTLDLHDNDLIVDYSGSSTPYAQIVNMVKSGLTELGGNGSGLTSTEVNNTTLPGTFLAVVDNGIIDGGITSLSDYGLIGTNTVLVKYTWFGDASLDGIVDGADYALVDTGFTSGGTMGSWIFGDFNYDGLVDSQDYALIDTGYIAQTGTLPEPGMIGLLLPAIGLLNRRRR